MKLTLVRLTRFLAIALAVTAAVPAPARAAADTLRTPQRESATGLEELERAVTPTPKLPDAGLEEIQYYESVEAAARAYPAAKVTKAAEQVAKEAGRSVSDLAVIAAPKSSLTTIQATASVWMSGRMAVLELESDAAEIPGFGKLEIAMYGSADALPVSAILLTNRKTPPELNGRADIVVIPASEVNSLREIFQHAARHRLARRPRRSPPAVGPVLGVFVDPSSGQVFMFV